MRANDNGRFNPLRELLKSLWQYKMAIQCWEFAGTRGRKNKCKRRRNQAALDDLLYEDAMASTRLSRFYLLS